MSETKFGEIGLSVKNDRGASVYQHSFGTLSHETLYHPGMKGFAIGNDPKEAQKYDLKSALARKFAIGHKAMQAGTGTGGAGTAGGAMVPVYLDPRIVDLTRKYTPLVELTPRVTNLGITADWNKITAKGSAAFLAEDAPLSEQDDTYDRVSKSIKYAYAVGRVTGPAVASYPSYILQGFQPTGSGITGSTFAPAPAPNAKQLAVQVKARALRELEENKIINGDSSTTAAEFDGLVSQIGTGNRVNGASAALTWDMIENAVQNAFDDGGRPNLAIASTLGLRFLRDLVISKFNYRPDHMVGQLPFGITSNLVLETMVGSISVLPSQFLNDASNPTTDGVIYFLDMDAIEMRVLQDMTFEDLAKTNDSQKFMLKMYETLAVKAPQFCSYLDAFQAPV